MCGSPIWQHCYHELFIYCKLLNKKLGKEIGNWGDKPVDQLVRMAWWGVFQYVDFCCYGNETEEYDTKTDGHYSNRSIKNNMKPITTRVIRKNPFQILENKNTKIVTSNVIILYNSQYIKIYALRDPMVFF